MDDYFISSGVDSWPEPVRVFTERETLVRLNELPMNLKQQAWREIQTNSPDLAVLLKDEQLRAVVARFDADIFIDARFAPSLPHERLKGRKS